MAKTFRRTGQVYQRHPINGAGDGVVSNAIAKQSGITGEVFSVSSGQGEGQRNRFWKGGGFFAPAANYLGRYVRIYNTPPDGGTLSTSRTGFRHEDQIARISAVDAGGDYVELEMMRFEDDSTLASLTVTIDIFAAADFTAASANFPALPHTSSDAGPVLHQVISLPNPTDKTLQVVPFVIGDRLSATSVRISDLFGLLNSIPTEAGLEWYLKDRPGYSMRDTFYQIARFVLDCGWTLVANRGRWLAGQTTGVQRMVMDDLVFFSDGEDSAKSMYLRMQLSHRNNANGGTTGLSEGGSTDTTNNAGISFALFPKWDPTVAPAGGSLDRGDGAGINAVCLQQGVSTAQNHHAGWDRQDGTSNQEPQWNPDASGGSFLPFTLNSVNLWNWRESWFAKNTQYTGFVAHPMKFPMGGTFHEVNYMMFGDKDEIALFMMQEGVGMSQILLGGLEPLPSQIQTSFFTTAPTRAGSNSIVRVGTQDPAALPSGPSYQVGDNLQLVGLQVNSPGHDWAGLAHVGEFIETAFIQAIGTVGAVGRITCIAKALFDVNDNDTFTIDDGEGNVVQFYYDTVGDAGGVGTQINISGDTTANDVAVSTQAAIAGSALNIAATVNGDFVELVHNTPNSAPTNVAIIESVGDPTFLVEGMEGSGYGITTDVLNNEYATGALTGEDPNPMFMAAPWHLTTTAFTAQNAVRLSNRARNGDVTYFDHNGQQNGQSDGHGFPAIWQPVPVEQIHELDPSSRTNRFGLVGFFVRDTSGNQWRGRSRYCHILSKKIRGGRFIRDRDGNYYFTVTPLQSRDQNDTTRETATIAIGPMPAALAVPA
jgi:hypothetical protein